MSDIVMVFCETCVSVKDGEGEFARVTDEQLRRLSEMPCRKVKRVSECPICQGVWVVPKEVFLASRSVGWRKT
jgi:hypothetical protein